MSGQVESLHLAWHSASDRRTASQKGHVMDRIGGGSTHWEQYTRVVHELMVTVPDDALTSIGTGDELSVTFQGRQGAATVKLSARQVDRLLNGDPRNRHADIESYS